MVLAALVLAGCGSSDGETKTFDEDGFGITFEYPADFQRTDDVRGTQSGAQPEESVALATSEDNAIFVWRYKLGREVNTEDERALKRKFDRELGQLAGMPLEGKRVDVGGPLAFRYEIDGLESPEDGRSTVVVTFDGDNEYFLNCQSVPDGRSELEAACNQAIRTLQLKDSA